MSFVDENIPESLTTGYESPVDELFVPLLRNARTYDIAVGYFTSGWLRDTAEGLAKFAISGGKSRWVVSPQLNEDDAKIILEGTGNKRHTNSTVENAEEAILELILALKTDARQELCSMIASGILQFKIAIPKSSQGMLHAKIGISTDNSGNKLAFSGSYNLTANAKSNWENIDVFRGWITPELSRIEKLEHQFQALWENIDPTFLIHTPSEELLKNISSHSGDKLSKYINTPDEEPLSEIVLRPYQEEAITNWFRSKCQGTFVMATGSGKTITALSAVERLKQIVVDEHEKALLVVIAVPLKHLLDQWYDEISKFGFRTIKCYENSNVWRQKLSEQMGALRVIGKDTLVALVTNATFSGGNFQNEIQRWRNNFLFIADEAHNLGSSTYLKLLPENADYRLALSATPERYNDDRGTKELFKYFGKPVIEFSIDDAISAGYLCEYYYYPHICEMSEYEYDIYIGLAERITEEAKKVKPNGDKTKEHIRLLGERADLLTGVNSKLDILVDQLNIQQSKNAISHTLIYCGSRVGEEGERHIERAQKLIGNKVGIKAHKFTAEEQPKLRRELLSRFSDGSLQALTAIKCLDEGVDIPATKHAYILASTANPREFIQRRGRVLRTYHGKEAAYIHDFLVVPPEGTAILDDMVDREITRAEEFSRIAINQVECLDQIEQIRR